MRTFRHTLVAIATALAGLLLAAAPASAATPVPIVTSVTPAADTTGSQVVVSGSNLTDPANGTNALPTAIMFGGVSAHVNSCAPSPAASCNVTVPPRCPGGPRVVDVTVSDGADGTSAVNPPGDQFTYTDAGTAAFITDGTPSPSKTPSKTPSETPSETPSGTPSPTVTPSKTPSGTPSPSETPTQTPTPTPTPSGTQGCPSPAPSGGVPPSGTLPVTGAVLAYPLMIGALALIALGTAALVILRRRHAR